jgi:heptosyltransferase-2
MKTALVISAQGIGNTVLMTPVIETLTEMGYQVDALVSDNGAHEVLQLRKDVCKQYLWRESDSTLRNFLRLRTELHWQQYDSAFALYPNGKRENVLLWLAQAAQKSRYSDKRNRFRLLDFLPAGDKVPLTRAHDVINNLRLIQRTESHPNNGSPRLLPSDPARDFAHKFFSGNRLTGKFVVAVHPGGGGTAKRWSRTKYRELCRRLTDDESIRILVFGSTNEKDLVRTITEGLSDRVVPVPILTIDQIAALISRSQLLVANDSALAHIASALSVPVVVIWGYTDFERAAPVNDRGLLVRIDYPCNPCYDFAKGYIDDCQYHLKCIKDISVEQIYGILKRYIVSLKNRESLRPEIFAGNVALAGLQRLDSGCLKIDLRAA